MATLRKKVTRNGKTYTLRNGVKKAKNLKDKIQRKKSNLRKNRRTWMA